MNVKDRIIELNKLHASEEIEIEEALLTIITKFQLFEPCRYLSEDEDWLNVAIISLEDNSISQPLCIRKSEITTFGIFNREEVELNISPSAGLTGLVSMNEIVFYEDFDVDDATLEPLQLVEVGDS